MPAKSVTGRGHGGAEGPLRGFDLDKIHKVRLRNVIDGNDTYPFVAFKRESDVQTQIPPAPYWITSFLINSLDDPCCQSFEIDQPGHGFAELTAIYNDGTGWKKATADAPCTLGTAIVLEVIDSNNFIAATLGRHELLNQTVTPGEYYYVSDSVAGLLTTTRPTSHSSFENPLVFAETDVLIHVLPYRPSVVAPPPAGTPMRAQAVEGKDEDTGHDILKYSGYARYTHQ